jgi:hypothetical protein
MSRDIVILTGHYGAEYIMKAIEQETRYVIVQNNIKKLYSNGLISDSEKERLKSMLSSSDEASKELAFIIIENLKNEHSKHTRNKPARRQHPFDRFR